MFRANMLSQNLDIAGSLNQSDGYSLIDEFNLDGPSTGNFGTSASITSVVSNTAIITGLFGLSSSSVGNFLKFSNAATASNNTSFLIIEFISSTSVKVSGNINTDTNSGSLIWTERVPYSLESDLNYNRTDRSLIKGIPYYQNLPNYLTPDSLVVGKSTNLFNIKGKTTDAKSFIETEKLYNISVGLTSFITISGSYKHSVYPDITGIPLFDGYDLNNYDSCYVHLTDVNGSDITSSDGYRVFGLTKAGASISGSSFEIAFYKVAKGKSLSTATPYTWNVSNPNIINILYPYRKSLDLINENEFRKILTNGISTSNGVDSSIYSLIGVPSGSSTIDGYLTNKTSFYPFSNLSAPSSILDALNELNNSFGDLTFTGPYLTSGDNITVSLQKLSNAITTGSGGIIRVNQKITSPISANTIITLPGGNSYTPSANGGNMLVYVRGLLKTPGALSAGYEYEEVSSTQIKLFTSLSIGDIVTYIIYM